MAFSQQCFAGLMLCLVLAWPAVAAQTEAGGHSLFQEVFTAADGRSAIPFPFPALLERLRQELAPGGEALRGGLPLVLIPLGRSLQRHAADEAGYFAYPRVVVAVTGEPRPGAPLLKDRLYIGYHELLGVLEVISYNETAGRFEFQLVRDYRPGGTPRLVQARRELCLACHQGAAPIFSRQTWDETAASPAIARLLEADLAPTLRSLPWRGGVDIPNAIDDATERANRLGLAQRLWQEGCGGDETAARTCRGELLVEAVLQRLSLPNLAAPHEPAGVDGLAPMLTRWPGGLALANPDIPNRLPLAGLDPVAREHPTPLQLRRLADVAAPFDALALRPPRDGWDGRLPGARRDAAAAVGLFLGAPELAAMDQALARSAAPTLEWTATGCQFSDAVDGVGVGAGKLRVTCAAPPLVVRLAWRGRQLGGEVEAPELGGASLGRQALVGEVQRQGAETRLALRASHRHLRGLDLVWAAGVSAPRVTLRLRDESAVLRQAVAALGQEGGALNPGPLDRRALVPGLLRHLGVADVRCCGRSGPMPAMPVEAPRPTPGGLNPELAVLFRNCAPCHDSGDPFPPAFLGGAPEGLTRRVTACAPRLAYRLAMGTVAENRRTKTPMPPLASAHGPGFVQTADYRSLIAWLEPLAGERLDALLQRPYADLPACRPAPD